MLNRDWFMAFGKRNWTDSQLATALRSGEDSNAAMKHLMQECWPILRNFILSRKGDEAEARDIFQEALTNLLIQVREGKYQGSGSLKNYLMAIGKGMWFNRFKRESRLSSFEQEHDSLSPDDPALRYAKQEQRKLLNHVLDQLKAKCRSVLMLWASHYSMKEIAERSGFKSPQVAMNKKNICLKELKELVRKQPSIRSIIREIYG